MDRFEAVQYVWKKSASIRKWYTEQHTFDINSVNRYNIRNYGVNQPGDLVDLILEDGIKDKIIAAELNDDNEYDPVVI